MIRLGNKMNRYQKLVDNLTKLNLHNMAASIADYRQQVNDNQISFSEALLKLTDKEITYQQQESLKRRICTIPFRVDTLNNKSANSRGCFSFLVIPQQKN